MKSLISRSSSQTRRIAAEILRKVAKNKSKPVILALTGELGSGKTTFIQGLAKALGIREKIQSPTFVLIKWYSIPKRFHRLHRFHRLVHIDAYRLERLSEARHIGLKEIFKDRDAIIVVEWAERIKQLVPRHAAWIRFRHGGKPSERVLKIFNFQ